MIFSLNASVDSSHEMKLHVEILLLVVKYTIRCKHFRYLIGKTKSQQKVTKFWLND